MSRARPTPQRPVIWPTTNGQRLRLLVDTRLTLGTATIENNMADLATNALKAIQDVKRSNELLAATTTATPHSGTVPVAFTPQGGFQPNLAYNTSPTAYGGR